MATSNLVIPLSIVIASVIVATGLYLGLQRPPAPAAALPPAASQPTPPTAPITAPTTSPTTSPPARPVPPPLTPEVQARAIANASAALEVMRPELRRRCWTPSVARRPEPARLPLTFTMSFTPQGQLVVLAISDDPKIVRNDVSTCLRSIAIPIKIPAPGHALQLEVPFVLP